MVGAFTGVEAATAAADTQRPHSSQTPLRQTSGGSRKTLALWERLRSGCGADCHVLGVCYHANAFTPLILGSPSSASSFEAHHARPTLL